MVLTIIGIFFLHKSEGEPQLRIREDIYIEEIIEIVEVSRAVNMDYLIHLWPTLMIYTFYLIEFKNLFNISIISGLTNCRLSDQLVT